MSSAADVSGSPASRTAGAKVEAVEEEEDPKPGGGRPRSGGADAEGGFVVGMDGPSSPSSSAVAVDDDDDDDDDIERTPLNSPTPQILHHLLGLPKIQLSGPQIKGTKFYPRSDLFSAAADGEGDFAQSRYRRRQKQQRANIFLELDASLAPALSPLFLSLSPPTIHHHHQQSVTQSILPLSVLSRESRGYWFWGRGREKGLLLLLLSLTDGRVAFAQCKRGEGRKGGHLHVKEDVFCVPRPDEKELLPATDQDGDGQGWIPKKGNVVRGARVDGERERGRGRERWGTTLLGRINTHTHTCQPDSKITLDSLSLLQARHSQVQVPLHNGYEQRKMEKEQ